VAASDVAREPRFLRGVADFNAGAFYEAHEVWEDLWNDSEGETRRVVQALVQLAAGYHKLEIGVPAGARKLLARALATLADVREAASPVALGPLCAALRAHLASLAAAGTSTIALTPRLEVKP
jgi:predicted metal-dependent hydrolase